MGHEIFRGKSKSMGGVLCGIEISIWKLFTRYRNERNNSGDDDLTH